MAEEERRVQDAIAYVRRRMPMLESAEGASVPVAHAVATSEANVIANKGGCPNVAVGIRDGEVACQVEVPRASRAARSPRGCIA